MLKQSNYRYLQRLTRLVICPIGSTFVGNKSDNISYSHAGLLHIPRCYSNKSSSDSASDAIPEWVTNKNIPLTLCFSGAGFLGVYHIGVSQCLYKHASKSVLSRVQSFSGASAGSIVASIMLFKPESLNDALTRFYHVAEKVQERPFGVLTRGFSLSQQLHRAIDYIIPEHKFEEVKDALNSKDRLIISLTRCSDNCNININHFKSREMLVKAIMASCYIPYVSGLDEKPIEIDGVAYKDGGFTRNLPEGPPETHTITISPFSGNANISPTIGMEPVYDWMITIGNQQIHVNSENLMRFAQAIFTPERQMLESYHRLGFQDCLIFLRNNKLLEEEPETEV